MIIDPWLLLTLASHFLVTDTWQKVTQQKQQKVDSISPKIIKKELDVDLVSYLLLWMNFERKAWHPWGISDSIDLC